MFDLDDTIVSFDGASMKAWDMMCREYTEKYGTGFSADEMNRVISEVRHEYWSDPERHKRGRENMKAARREVMLKAMPLLGENDEDRILAAADRYTYLQNELICLFDGAYEALERIKKAGYKTALVTNGSSEGQRAKIARFGLYPLFDEIIIDTEVGVSKPSVGIYRIALDRLGVTAVQAAMIGDKPEWDTIPARKMGIFTVWNNFAHKNNAPPDTADLTVNSVWEFSEFLLGRA